MFNEETTKQTDDLTRLTSADRHMSVTPIDMRQREFGAAMRGFDRSEVTAFLVEAAGEYELALRENDRLRQEIIRLEASLHQFRELEGSLKSTLRSAQKIADDMRENAVKESQRILREAEGQAEVIVQATQGKIDAAQRDVGADRQVDASREDHQQLAQGDDADAAGLLEDVSDVPERHEDVALGRHPEEQHHQSQDEERPRLQRQQDTLDRSCRPVVDRLRCLLGLGRRVVDGCASVSQRLVIEHVALPSSLVLHRRGLCQHIVPMSIG
jgi:cell division initiation protein